jgi:alcohol oxidase
VCTGGTAGCLVAGRLATADPNLRILVLEAGGTTEDDPAHRNPALFLSHILPGSKTVRGHESRPSAALGGRTTIVQTGQCLGGGGSVNCAFFPPPHPSISPLLLLGSPIFSDRELKKVDDDGDDDDG